MWRPETFRKMLILLGMGLSNFSEAYIFGHTACLIAGLFEEKVDLGLTDDDISWIMSLMYSSMVFGTLLGSMITEKIGRRFTIIVCNVPVIVHWFMLYYARDRYVFMIARLLAGIGFGGALPVIYMATAECSSPKMRSFNLAIITTVVTAFGATVGSYLGIVYDWRTASLVGLAPALLSSIIPFLCVESPPWLASKGRFDECEIAYISLHGHTPSAQKELQLILEVEKSKFNNRDKNTNAIKLALRRLRIAATKRYFWDIMLIASIINIYKMIVGRVLFGSFGIIILQKITGQSNILSYSLAINIISILGSFITIVMLKKINVRSVLFPSGIFNCLLLFGLSISLYTVPDNYDSSLLVWTNVLLYIIHISVIQIVLSPILEALPAELYPIEIRGACNTIVAFIGTGFAFVILKITPAMFASVDFYGVFSISALAMLVLLLYLWIKLPETKGRSLTEIELGFKNQEFVIKRDDDSRGLRKELI